MISVPGGEFVRGSDTTGHTDRRPAHTVQVTAFAIDATLVTVAEFKRFVAETDYQTDAERLGFGMVSVEGMANWAWEERSGATWEQPWGPSKPHVQGSDEPVVMVSWNDADAYCRHKNKRLPTEAEWEYAMRAGSTERFPWGSSASPNGTYRLNFWQGVGHEHNDRKDGHVYTSPVRSFPPNAWGIYDPVGNVWQWTNDWFGPYPAGKVVDPSGPAKGWAKVARGGSWWCSEAACSGYGLEARGKNQPSAPYANNGFRCAR